MQASVQLPLFKCQGNVIGRVPSQLTDDNEVQSLIGWRQMQSLLTCSFTHLLQVLSLVTCYVPSTLITVTTSFTYCVCLSVCLSPPLVHRAPAHYFVSPCLKVPVPYMQGLGFEYVQVLSRFHPTSLSPSPCLSHTVLSLNTKQLKKITSK